MSFAEQPVRGRHAGVPLAPMLDVLFLLLIFFVTTSSFRAEEQAVEVGLPTAETGASLEPLSTEVVVNITPDGRIVVANQEMAVEKLKAMLGQLVREFPDERVILRGDKQSTYERVIEVIDAARSAGVRHIHFATIKQASEVR